MPDKSLKSRQDKFKHEFVEGVSHFLDPNCFKGNSLYGFLRNRSKLWHVGYVDIHEIIIEGVKRGIEYIDKEGQEIKKPEAWLRRVCLHVLSDKVDEIVKEERKVEAQKSTLLELQNSSHSQPELTERIEYMKKALESLSTDDRDIIKMRFFERKNYEQIRYTYESKGQVVTVPALRKRESRALERLRVAFFSLSSVSANIVP